MVEIADDVGAPCVPALLGLDPLLAQVPLSQLLRPLLAGRLPCWAHTVPARSRLANGAGRRPTTACGLRVV